MYYILALFTGILISVMVAFNGSLTATYGLYLATVIIHAVGLVVIISMLIYKRESPFAKSENRPPRHLYLGGAIGVATVYLTNFAFGSISVSALLALGLFGQSLTGIAVDQFGLFGMKKYPFKKRKLVGLTIMLAGIGVMVMNFGDAAFFAALAALGTGATIVLSRVFNARLATFIGTRRGVFYTHVVGLVLTSFVLVVLVALGWQDLVATTGFAFPGGWYMYLGGLLGVVVISLDNFTAVRLPAFYLALLLFVGQVSSGLAVDFVIERAVNGHNIAGGLLVALGLCVNVLLDKSR